MDSWPAPEVPRLADLGLGTGRPPNVPDTSSGALTPVDADGGAVRIYVCGITPYDATHLGHAATYLLFDTIQRVCRDAGLRVHYVQNVTDIDDPLLERAAQTGEDWAALAARETQLFRDDMAALRILPPDDYVGAVEAMPLIVDAIAELVACGAAYELEGDIYFSVGAAPHFGDVSRLPVGEMLQLSAERGGDPQRPGKKDPLDCLLWQRAREGEPAWDSPFGPGRPGWHVECAAIALHHLGPELEVNGGGSDLVFPHHELGAAESNVLTGRWPIAKAFVHQAMVGYDGEKMSKSRGNLVLVSALRQAGVDPMAIRLALLAHPAGAEWEWRDHDLTAAEARLEKWRAAIARPSAAPAQPAVDGLRAALQEGIDAPEALRVIDAWTATDGTDVTAPRQIAAAVDALLGVV